MKIVATPIKSEALKPGDLFSTYGPEYWERDRFNRTDPFDTIPITLPLGERVYIRTETPAPADQVGEDLFKITIEQ